MKCLKELSTKIGFVPFQTSQVFESLKELQWHDAVCTCLDLKIVKTEKKFVQHLTTTAIKALAELVHPVEGEIFQFPSIFQTENTLSTEIIECSQDNTIRAALAKAALKQNILPVLTELFTHQEANVRVAALRTTYQLCRFSTEFSHQISTDTSILQSLISLVKDTTDIKAMYETELSALTISIIFKDSPKIISQLGKDTDALVGNCIVMINTSLDERLKCFCVLLLSRLAQDTSLKKRIISELLTPVGLGKINDILIKDVSCSWLRMHIQLILYYSFPFISCMKSNEWKDLALDSQMSVCWMVSLHYSIRCLNYGMSHLTICLLKPGLGNLYVKD